MTAQTLEKEPTWTMHKLKVFIKSATAPTDSARATADAAIRGIEGFEKQLADLLDDDKVCDGCGFFNHCEDEPYDCNAMDALRKIAGKETK